LELRQVGVFVLYVNTKAAIFWNSTSSQITLGQVFGRFVEQGWVESIGLENKEKISKYIDSKIRL
jgi:hypothetical protein